MNSFSLSCVCLFIPMVDVCVVVVACIFAAWPRNDSELKCHLCLLLLRCVDDGALGKNENPLNMALLDSLIRREIININCVPSIGWTDERNYTGKFSANLPQQTIISSIKNIVNVVNESTVNNFIGNNYNLIYLCNVCWPHSGPPLPYNYIHNICFACFSIYKRWWWEFPYENCAVCVPHLIGQCSERRGGQEIFIRSTFIVCRRPHTLVAWHWTTTSHLFLILFFTTPHLSYPPRSLAHHLIWQWERINFILKLIGDFICAALFSL